MADDVDVASRNTANDLLVYEPVPEKGIWKICTNNNGVEKNDNMQRSNKSVS
ncbi:MAG: hypothetical protein ACTSX1_08070 [Candidatus Heimdallarchaeaceae archaeon]